VPSRDLTYPTASDVVGLPAPARLREREHPEERAEPDGRARVPDLIRRRGGPAELGDGFGVLADDAHERRDGLVPFDADERLEALDLAVPRAGLVPVGLLGEVLEGERGFFAVLAVERADDLGADRRADRDRDVHVAEVERFFA